MKKSLLMVAFAMVAMVSSAQIYVGGGLGFTSDKVKVSYDGDSESESGSSFYFKPEVGYVLNETLSFGLTFDFTSDKEIGDDDAVSQWSIAPYARYTFYRTGNLSCFVDGVLGFGVPEEDFTNFSIGVRPGVALSLTENISLVSTIGLVGWNSLSTKEDDLKLSYSTLNLGVDGSAISFGLYYTF
ncbi:MAG: porin family protein [Bacteroidales bacterium]|nr:porin family protein [Bacteroidales bacterium]